MNLTGVEKDILIDILHHGDNPSGNIADNIGKNRTYVSECLGDLEKKGLVENKGRSTYTLTNAGVSVAQNVYRQG